MKDIDFIITRTDTGPESPARLRECLKALCETCGQDSTRVEVRGSDDGKGIVVLVTSSREASEGEIARMAMAGFEDLLNRRAAALRESEDLETKTEPMVTPQKVGAYLRRRVEEGAHPSSIDKELTTLRQVLRYAKRDGNFLADIDAVMPINFDHEYEPRETFLTPAEAWTLIAAQAEKRKGIAQAYGLRCAARTAFFLATGARDGELGRARREDVNLSTWLVKLRGTKTRLSLREVPVVLDDCRRLLVAALMSHPLKDGLLFGPWDNAVRDLGVACKRAKLHRVTPNDLRRSHAHWLRARGIEPALIGSVLGHTDSRMVERVYGRLKPEELRDVIASRLVQIQSTDPPPGPQTSE